MHLSSIITPLIEILHVDLAVTQKGIPLVDTERKRLDACPRKR